MAMQQMVSCGSSGGIGGGGGSCFGDDGGDDARGIGGSGGGDDGSCDGAGGDGAGDITDREPSRTGGSGGGGDDGSCDSGGGIVGAGATVGWATAVLTTFGVVSMVTPRRVEAASASLSLAESRPATAAAVCVAGGVMVAVMSTLAGAMVR